MALNAQEFLAAIRKAADSKNDAGDVPVTEMCEKISPDEHIRADLFIKPEKEEQEEVYPYTIQKSIVLISDVPLETENCDSDREIPLDESRGTISVSMDNSESQLPGLSQSGYDSCHFVSYAELNRTKSKKGILRVAAYIRVSTDLDDQENSYETQERYFTELLQRNPEWTSAGIYSDYGISGTNKQNRIGYNRLLRHCSEGKIDRIVCKSISRFARNTSDFMTALKLLHDNHVTIIFEKENLNTEDQTSNFILTTLAAIAQEESRSISSNIRWGIQKRYPKGQARNYDIYGYRYVEGDDGIEIMEGGYQIRKLEVVEDEATVVRRIFNEVKEGRGFSDIARELNAEHIPAPKQRNNKKKYKNINIDRAEIGWTGPIISRICSSERYCGDVLLQKTYTPDFLTHRSQKNKGNAPQYMVYDHHPAIIDRELFRKVQELKKINSSHYNNHSGQRKLHAFSGRLVCASCGRFYNSRNTNSHLIWFCPASNLNNGMEICCAEKIYEEQVIQMLRKAFLNRFWQNCGTTVGDLESTNIINSKYLNENSIGSYDQRNDLVSQMCLRLENAQKTDHIERDRSFLKRKINSLQVKISENERLIRKTMTQKDNMEIRRNLMNDLSVTEEEIASAYLKLEEENASLYKNQEEKNELERRLLYMENYWRDLENDYAEREKALEWMSKLPGGKVGTAALLNGLTSNYVRAFVLSITVHDPFHFTVHWFDDTRTEVEMYNNAEKLRYTSKDMKKYGRK